MLRKIGLGAFSLSLWLIAASDAIASGDASVIIKDSCVAGEKVKLETTTDVELPSSSFYRIGIDCPVKPSGAEILAETGYPISDIEFSLPGNYECEVEIGYVVKSSCAGVQYSHIAKKTFGMSVAPRGAESAKK